MRLWSIHPSYLDRKGLVALWGEGLLAKNILEGKTKGFKNHPQLERFKNYNDPILAINSYLYCVYLEAKKRNYNFDINKINIEKVVSKIIPVTKGQIEYEFSHLCKKLKIRDAERFKKFVKNLKRLNLTQFFML